MLLNTSRPSGSWLAAMSTRPDFAMRPPSATGRKTRARSCRPAGGKARPSSGQSRPVPLATAAISIAALVPSVKELYIFGIEVALGDLLVGPAEEAPDGIRRGIAVARLEIHPLAGRGHLEAGGARPVDQFADQRRLVAVGHRVDEALRPRLLGEDRPDHHVGLDVDHHEVFAGIDRRQRMAGAGDRMTRRLDDALDLVAGEQRVDARR